MSKLSGAERVNPYEKEGRAKGEQVKEMFDSIAPAYDFMNTAMTFGLHRFWRENALNAAAESCPDPVAILDVATGTGDVAFSLAKRFPAARVTGVDLSRRMLEIAEKKLWKLPEDDARRIKFETGDSLALRFNNNFFDLITVAYGVRNFEHLRHGLSEMRRVLRPEGTLCIIELSQPQKPLWRKCYDLYSHKLIPMIGRMVSGDSRAYIYLPESIAAAPQRDELAAILRECGFKGVRWHSLTFGAVTYYLATKL